MDVWRYGELHVDNLDLFSAIVIIRQGASDVRLLGNIELEKEGKCLRDYVQCIEAKCTLHRSRRLRS